MKRLWRGNPNKYYAIMYDIEGNSTRSTTVEMYGYACFVANTKILTEEGLKNIQDVKVGDYVYSRNDNTGKIELKEVKEFFEHKDIEIYKVHTSETVIEATKYHPWYVVGKGYANTKDLKVGDKLIDIDGNEVEITEIEYCIKPEAIKVYNIEVEGNNNYFVGDKCYLVHNKVN